MLCYICVLLFGFAHGLGFVGGVLADLCFELLDDTFAVQHAGFRCDLHDPSPVRLLLEGFLLQGEARHIVLALQDIIREA